MPEMVNVVEFASDNLLAMWIAARGNTGFFAGIDNLDATDTGSDSGMRRLRGGVNFPSPISPRPRANTRGDGKNLATWRRSPNETADFELEMAVRDVVAETFMGGGHAYALGSYRLLGILGATVQRAEDILMLMHRAAQSEEVSTLNDEGYENFVAFSNKLEPLGPESVAQDDDGNSRYSGTTNSVEMLPYGVTVEAASDFTDGMVASYVTEYPDMYHVIVGNGSATTIVVDLEPVDDAVWRVEVIDFTAGGTFKTVTDVDVATKTITVSGALNDGHIFLVIYQFHPKQL